MRTLGQSFLPQWVNEDNDSYKKRLQTATLLPAYEETIKQNIGRVFASPIKLSDTVPNKIAEFLKDIDLEGTCLDVWAQQFFSLAMQYGIAHALVDYPRINKEIKTKADENEIGARPYVVMLNPRQIIGWKSKNVGGKVILTELRIKETIVADKDDYSQTKVEQIRHLEIGRVTIWQKDKDKDTWLIADQWETSSNKISLVTLYTKKIGFMKGTPPLLNLALLNIKHWQSQSEQDNILHVARVPILTAFGLEDGAELTIGSSCATKFSDRGTQGLEYVEHSGSSVNAGKESLVDLVEQMRLAGAKLLRDQNTSTKSIDQTQEEKMQSNSPLFTMASSLEDSLDNILDVMAEWVGLKTGGNVDVVTEVELARKTIDASGALAVQALRQSGDIRYVDAVVAYQRLGLIDPDIEPEDVIQELKDSDPQFVG
nr:DUF4055 domain-containing protein [Gilliamella sp. B3482]